MKEMTIKGKWTDAYGMKTVITNDPAFHHCLLIGTKKNPSKNTLFEIKQKNIPNTQKDVPHFFLCYTGEHTQRNNPHEAFGSAPCRLSVGRIFLVCTKYCRMPRLSPFSRLNALNLICFATLDWYLPKHNSA